MDILNVLNEAQRKAVTVPGGPALILAGPGSGKTRVLTHRIAYLIDALGVRPYRILAVTFTNKAAREMANRVDRLLPERTEGLWLGTFHSICARILRREAADYLPFKSSFVIMDEDDQQALIKKIIKEFNIDDKLYKPSSVAAGISSAKNQLITAEEFRAASYREEVIGRVYRRYQELLLENNGVDFDDLLLYTWKLFQEHPKKREEYARRYEHVLVDEFQDTNTAQYELLRHLSSYHRNLFVVGDEDQSIYRWRGADYRNVLRFEADYPGCQKILLEHNYRSTQTVLDTAVAVIDQNPNRTRKELFTERGRGEPVTLYEAADDHTEAAYVVDTIMQLWKTGRQARGGDFAVMYRTNAQSRLIEEAFLRAGLPYRLVGAQRFYGRREVKDIIAYLRLVQNPADGLSLARVINVPGRGIGDKTLVGLQLAAQNGKTNAGEVLLDLARSGGDSPYYKSLGRSANLLADFGVMLADWLKAAENLPLVDLFDKIIADTVYEEYINDGSEEGRSRWENVQELRRLAYEFQERGLTAFLENLALVSDQDTVPEYGEAPTLLTLHAAKGLEFSQVFITGLDEGLLPHSRSLDDPEQMAEERRLFYVGLTRAKDRLYLVRAERRSNYGSYEYSIPSRFLEDIPEALIRRYGSAGGQRQSPTWSRGGASSSSRGYLGGYTSGETRALRSTTTPPPPQSAPIVQPKYKAGMHVLHAAWGEGLVLESKLIDGDEQVDVVFKSVGFKRLAASLANLQVVG